MGDDGWKQFWEEVTEQPSSAVIVERMVRQWSRPVGVINEIMRKVDQAVEASTPDEPVYATCAMVYYDWEPTGSRDAFITLAMIDDVRLITEEDRTAINSEIPRDNRNPPDYALRGFFWLVRKRIDEITADQKS